MNYEQCVVNMKPLTIDKVVKLSYELLPSEKRRTPWKFVNHGVDVAYSEEWLLAYMAAYGEMHQIKCRAALQNFPFEKISNLEIFDWGCGQGLATIVFLEMLAERNLSHLVRKVTLIEPSASALKRAELNISYAIEDNVKVVPIQKYLPSSRRDVEKEVVDIETQMPNVIHLFSNILDIPQIDISYLSRMISDCSHTNYVICVGPKNHNSFRINQFAAFFNSKELFSGIDSYQFAYTPRTHHNITCCTSCFSFNGDFNVWNGENEYRQYADKQVSWEYEDDYSPVKKVFAGQLSSNLLDVYEKIDNQLIEGERLFLKPNINGDKPDLLLFQPNAGISLIQIYDEYAENLDKDYLPNKLVETIEILNGYSKRLVDLHIESLKEQVEANNSALSVIKKIIVCIQNETSEIEYLKNDQKYRFYKFVGKDRLEKFFRQDTNLVTRNCYFTTVLKEAFLQEITAPWHSYRQGIRLNLTKRQEELARSKANSRQKIKGHAGCGKTQVMAWRAVNAMIRTGSPILILTFNITLRNYIRYRIQQIPADFNWGNIIILNYHEFFNSQALNVDRRVTLENYQYAYEKLDYFDGCIKALDSRMDGLSQFSAIFVDEVQDYKSEWLRILQKYFLAEKGEFVVFGDKTQNVYNRALDKNEIIVPNIPGAWNEIKGRIARFESARIAKLAQRFSEYFLNATFDAEQKLDFDDEEVTIKYAQMKSPTQVELYGSWSLSIMKRYELSPRNTAIISVTCDILREIESYLNSQNMQCKTTFMSKELFVEAAKNSSYYLKRLDDSISRAKKMHFTTDCDMIKLSTIFSFKGWESENIILFIQKEEESDIKSISEAPVAALIPSVIYTALTRARKKLFIINIENKSYHNFFKDNI